MKRIIRFRAWDSELKQMSKTFSFGQVLNFNNTHLRSLNSDKHTVLQYTGLQDADGNDIYEGDIIQWHYHPTEDESQIATQKVVWGEGGFFVLDLDSLGSDCLFEVMHREIRVIGNIYQHQNLLQP